MNSLLEELANPYMQQSTTTLHITFEISWFSFITAKLGINKVKIKEATMA
jgi:hypothetical protein